MMEMFGENTKNLLLVVKNYRKAQLKMLDSVLNMSMIVVAFAFVPVFVTVITCLCLR